MKDSLKQSLDNVDMTYQDLLYIADDIIHDYVSEINDLISFAYSKSENLTNDMLRDLIIKLSLKGFTFGDTKEKSILKSQCAESLRKEAYAKQFSMLDGSVAAKDTKATLNISDEILTDHLYSLISSLFKTKLDEIHRCVDALKTVLMSRLQEAKLSNTNIGE